MVIFTCLRCSYSWNSNKLKPLECPKCKSYHWNEKSTFIRVRETLPKGEVIKEQPIEPNKEEPETKRFVR